MNNHSTRSSSTFPANRSVSKATSKSNLWITRGLWVSYLTAIALLIAAVLPGTFNNVNSHSWIPQLGLRLFQFEARAVASDDPHSIGGYGPYLVVFLLSSTCVTPWSRPHGGGKCSSNLGATWSTRQIYNAYSPINKFLNLEVNDPGIATPAICGLLIVAILLSGLILLAPWLARHLKAGAISGRKWDISVRKEQISVLQTIMGLIAFVFALVGAAMARVQVSKTVSALLEAQAAKQKDSPTTHAEEEDSEVLWIIIWVAVALLGCNLLALVFRGVGDIRKKQHLVVLE